MKKITLILGIFVAMMALNMNLMAQDTEISDDDLKLYASVMSKIDVLKSDMKTAVNEMVKGEELMNGGRRYKALKKANGDSLKLIEVEATEEEKVVFNDIQEKIKALKVDFKANTSSLVKEELGAGTYNKLRKALRADADLKAKYDAIVEALKAENSDNEDVE